MPPDWNAIRLDLLDIDAPVRATLREMRPFFANALPGILAAFYDKVRHYDPASGIFKDGAVQEAIRLQLQHWDLIGAAEFGLPYFGSVARLSEFHQRAGVAPQWYVGCRLMFIADQLMKAVETEVEVHDKWASMQNAIAKAVMLDTGNAVTSYFGFNRQAGAASSQSQSSAKQLSDSTASLRAEIDGFLKSIAAAA